MADRTKTYAGPEGIRVTVTAGDMLPSRTITRYTLALRRKAANRARRIQGFAGLPEIRAGRCEQCKGWGVCGGAKLPCPACGGSGE